MQKHSVPHINHNHQDKNERRISVNYFHPKQSKFLDTIYPNSAEDKETEKSKTYRNSPKTYSDFNSKFIVESEQMPTQITPFKNESKEINPNSKIKKQTNYNFILDYKFYIHCGACLTIISGENELQYENKNFLKISKIFNSDSTFSNSHSNLDLKEKENLNKKYDIVYCAICGNNLGIDLTKFKEYITDLPMKIEKPHMNSVSSFLNSLSRYFLLKNRIIVKNGKNLKVGLCGLKLEKIVEIENSLKEVLKMEKENFYKEQDEINTLNNIKNFNNVLNDENNQEDYDQILNKQKEFSKTKIPKNYPTIEFVSLKQTKESLQNFSLIKNTKLFSDLDMIFIIHKLEGRVFLVGRNGYYNKLYENLYQLVKGNFFFLLMHKKLESDDSLESNSDILDNLINKGDQQLLQVFRDENKIIFLNDEKCLEDIRKKKFFFLDLFYRKFVINSYEGENEEIQKNISSLNTFFINNQIRQFTNEDFILIDQFLFKLKNKTLKENGKTRDYLKCFVL